MRKADRIAIVMVHGTRHRSAANEEEWFDRGSAFAAPLVERLAARGVGADVLSYHWSGANSARQREAAADKLADALVDQSGKYNSVHLVAHSHGGNVAADAAWMLGWPSKRARRHLASITTVGTPFLKCALTRGEAWGGIAFFIVSLLSVLGLVLVLIDGVQRLDNYSSPMRAGQTYYQERCRPPDCAMSQGDVATAVAQNPERFQRLAKDRSQHAWATVATALVSAVALFFVLPLAFHGLRRVRRLRAARRDNGAIHAIWHPEDEAIAFLQLTERLKVDPFPRGSLLRGSQMLGILFGVRLVLLVIGLGAVLWLAHQLGVRLNSDVLKVFGGLFSDAIATFEKYENHRIPLDQIGIAAIQFGTAGAPLLFAFVYLLVRLVAGIGPEYTMRDWMNRTVANILRSMALGRDGDERVAAVLTSAHSFSSTSVKLAGDVADRMRANAESASEELLRSYRARLFTVGAKTENVLDNLLFDVMTWKSLIHTTYFEQPEIVDVIANYIADQAALARAPRRGGAARGRGRRAVAALPARA